MRWVFLAVLALVSGVAGAQKPAPETITCSFVGGDGAATILKFVADEKGILWKVSYNPDFMQAMSVTVNNQVGIVAVQSSIDNPQNEVDRLLPVVAHTVVIERRTGNFVYSRISAEKDGSWIYRGKCVRG